jgi:hypothetical protein
MPPSPKTWVSPNAPSGSGATALPSTACNRLEPAEILGWYLPHLFGEVMAPAMLDDLEPIVRSWRPDVVVHDSWEFAGANAGIPSTSHTLGLRHDNRVLSASAAAWLRCGGSGALTRTQRLACIGSWAWTPPRRACKPTNQDIWAPLSVRCARSLRRQFSESNCRGGSSRAGSHSCVRPEGAPEGIQSWTEGYNAGLVGVGRRTAAGTAAWPYEPCEQADGGATQARPAESTHESEEALMLARLDDAAEFGQ